MVAGLVTTQRVGDYLIAAEGFESIDFANAPQKVKRLAATAINATSRRYRTESSRLMRDQIAFPARYLDSRTDGRLSIVRFAAPTMLEAAIQGRAEPTSLARFVKGARTPGRVSPTVEVATGVRRKMTGAFLMSLKRGTQSGGNVGLAIRLKPGEAVRNKTTMVQAYATRTQNQRRPSDRFLYLLYGPSIGRICAHGTAAVAPDAAAYLAGEFARLSERIL